MSTGGLVSAREIVVSTFEVRTGLALKADSIMREAYRRLGHSLKVLRFPGARALVEANTGNVDGELFRVGGVEKNFENLIRVPLNISSVELVAFTKNKVFPLTGWESLLPYSVGYRIGIKAVEQNIPDEIIVEPVATYRQVFLMLDTGRTDVAIASRTAGMEAIQALGLKEITSLEPPLRTMKLYHYLNVKNKVLVAPLIAVLQTMKEEGLLL